MNKKSEAAILGLVEDPVDENALPTQINEEPEQLPPLQLEPIDTPVNNIAPIPEPISTPEPVEQDNNVLNAQPNEDVAEPAEEPALNAPSGAISLPPIIDPNLLPQQL